MPLKNICDSPELTSRYIDRHHIDADNVEGVRECPITRCPIYPYRLGKRPVISSSQDQQ